MEAITILGNNSYYYNFNITEDENGDERFDYVKLFGIPNYKDCVKAVIRFYYSVDEELELINDYNQAIMDSNNLDLQKIENYKSFLTIREQIKEMVKQDFNK